MANPLCLCRSYNTALHFTAVLPWKPCTTVFTLFLSLQVIQFALRDYIQYWYYTLSEDESFLLEIRQTLQNALVQFCTRYTTHTHTRIYAPCWIYSSFRFVIDLMQNHSQGPKRWTGSLTSPLAWLMTLPLIYECLEKPKIALQTERTSKVS